MGSIRTRLTAVRRRFAIYPWFARVLLERFQRWVTHGVLRRPRVVKKTGNRLYDEGRGLTQAEVTALERRLRETPDDLDSRIKLIVQYGQYVAHPPFRKPWAHHVSYVVRHAPSRAGSALFHHYPFMGRESYDLVAGAWRETLAGEGVTADVLGNAAQFFRFEEPAFSEQLYRQAWGLEPGESRWPLRLAQHLVHTADRPEAPVPDRLGQFDAALPLFAQAFALQPDEKLRWRLLPQAGTAAVKAGRFETAERYAREILAATPRMQEAGLHERARGTVLHQAHLMLGHVALHSGDLDTAGECLLEAARVPGMQGWIPQMGLAKGLLEKGRRTLVLDYLELCDHLLVGPGRLLHETLKRDIAVGKNPQFINEDL